MVLVSEKFLINRIYNDFHLSKTHKILKMRLSNKQKESFYKRFHRLYGKSADKCIKRLEELIKRYKKSIPQHIAPLDQAYTILITYGDSIRENSQTPLESLRHFLLQRFIGVFTAIHILPFFPYSSDDGFSVIDYHKVRSDLGDWSHIEAINDKFELMTDLVINHVSSQNSWFKDYLMGRDRFRNYFLEIDPEVDLGSVIRPRTTPLLKRVITRNGVRHVWTTFGPDQIDLNFANPDVLFEFIDILIFYISNGTRIVRLDAVPYLWKKIGTSCVNLEETHEIVKLLRQLIDVLAPNVLLLAESNFSDKNNFTYFGDGAEAHLLYQFALPPLLLHAFHTGRSAYLREWASALSNPPSGCTFLNPTATHDGIMLNPIENLIPESEIVALVAAVQERGGMTSFKHNVNGSQRPYELNSTYFDAIGRRNTNSTELIKRFLCSQTIALSLTGIPIIYLNSLMAARNDQVGVERLTYPRAINRYKWNKADLDELLDNNTSIASRVFTEYLKRLRIRAQHTAFHPFGRQDILDLPDCLFGVTRTSPDQNETIISINNISGEQQLIDLRNYCLEMTCPIENKLLLTGQESLVRDSKILLAPYESCWVKIC